MAQSQFLLAAIILAATVVTVWVLGKQPIRQPALAALMLLVGLLGVAASLYFSGVFR